MMLRVMRGAAASAALLLGAAGGCATAGAPVDRLGAAEYDWTLTSLDGEDLELGAFRGRVVVLNVWATWCEPCVAELASFARLRGRLAESDVAFVFASHEPADRVRAFVRRHDIRLPIYVERDPVPESMGVHALPTTLVIAGDGSVVLRHRGAADWDSPELAATLRRLAGS